MSEQIAVGARRAAEMVDVSLSTIWRQIRAGTLRSRHLGGRTVVLVADLEQFVKDGAPVPPMPIGPKGGSFNGGGGFGGPLGGTAPRALERKTATA
jgi:predicted DNA-binding transcriptional regulator AlpA